MRANMQHLNYLPRSSGGFNRARCVLDSSQMHHLTPTRTLDMRDRNTYTTAPLPVLPLETTQKSIVFLTSAISRQLSMVP